MISIVCWKWPGSRTYEAHHVNTLARMVFRHYRKSFRFICVTAEPEGLNPSIKVVAPPRLPQLERLESLHGAKFPACYRRLWNFSEEAGKAFGPRFFCLDIDTVITGDLTPILDRTEDFVIWGDPGMTWSKYGGGAYLMSAGCRSQVWEDFDPENSPAIAKAAGFNGSDQAWISYCLYPNEATYTREDGMYSRLWIQPGEPLPEGARMVHFSGRRKPWSKKAQKESPWVKEFC